MSCCSRKIYSALLMSAEFRVCKAYSKFHVDSTIEYTPITDFIDVLFVHVEGTDTHQRQT